MVQMPLRGPMAASATSGRRHRGSVEELPSGALRASVYAGIDPVAKRRHYLREVIPASPAARNEAEKALRRLANQVDERRNPRTNTTLNQLLDRHFDMLDLEPNTVLAYREFATNHIRPLIGAQKVSSLGGDVFDSFYAELRRCRHRCNGRPYVEHRTDRAHDCDERCCTHVCRPLAPATARKIHVVLSGALNGSPCSSGVHAEREQAICDSLRPTLLGLRPVAPGLRRRPSRLSASDR